MRVAENFVLVKRNLHFFLSFYFHFLSLPKAVTQNAGTRVLYKRFSPAQSWRDSIDNVRQRFAAKPPGYQSRGRFAQSSYRENAG